jgi:hypothetical protein
MPRLVLFGHSGSGKSTSAALGRAYYERTGRRVALLKLASPLYALQHAFYQAAGRAIDPLVQDQVLLELIAQQLRRISATSLVDDFRRRLAETEAEVILNDDLRDIGVDYPALQELGFRFVRVWCEEPVRLRRLAKRTDIAAVPKSSTTAHIDAIAADAWIDNSEEGIDHLRTKLEGILVGLPA